MVENKKTKNIKYHKVFTNIVVIFPILSIYSMGGTSATLGDLLLILIIPILSFKMIVGKSRLVDSVFIPMIPYISFVVIQFIFLALYGAFENFVDIGLRTLRYTTYLAVVIIFAKRYFLVDLGIKTYKKVAIFATFYLIIQYVFLNTINIYIPGHLPFLHLNSEQLEFFHLGLRSVHRPPSIFGEPNHYVYYVLGYLCLSLFTKGRKGSLLERIFLVVGILLASSTTGIIAGAILLFVWFIDRMRRKFTMKKAFVTYFLFISSIFVVMFSAPTQYFIDRIKSGILTDSRIAGYIDLAGIEVVSALEYFIGRGMIGITTYMASYARMIYYFGILGFSIFAMCMLISLVAVSSKEKRILLMLFLFLGTVSGIIISHHILLYGAFIVGSAYADPNNMKDASKKEFG